MTPVERYQHLIEFWKAEANDAHVRRHEALNELRKWANKLVAAEIAEQLSKEER